MPHCTTASSIRRPRRRAQKDLDAVRADHPSSLRTASAVLTAKRNGSGSRAAGQHRRRTLLEGFITDITAQQLASTALRDEARYRRLAENAPDIITGTASCPTVASIISARLFSTRWATPRRRSTTSRTCSSARGRGRSPPAASYVRRGGAGGGTAGDMLIRVRHRDGRPLWLALRACRVGDQPWSRRGHRPRRHRADGVRARTAHERKHLRAILRRGDRHPAHGPGGLHPTDQPALQALLGYSADELHGMTILT